MFDRNNLFKENLLEKAKNEFGDLIITCSLNSAYAFLLLYDLIKNNIETVEIEETVSYIAQNLCRKQSFMDNTSSPLVSNLHSNRCALLQAKFFYYYFTRLPILLNKTTFYNKTPNRQERKALTEICLDNLSEKTLYFVKSFPHVFSGESVSYNLTRDYDKASNLTRWYSKKAEREDFLYDYSWIFHGPLQYEKDILPSYNESVNFNLIMNATLEKYFYIFWGSLRENYIEQICFRKINA